MHGRAVSSGDVGRNAGGIGVDAAGQGESLNLG